MRRSARGSGAVRYAVAILLLAIVSVPAIAEPIDPQDIRVIDGDTIRVYHEPPDVRLVGFNAPETRRAVCEAEAELGAKATRRLRDLVRAGSSRFRIRQMFLPRGNSRHAHLQLWERLWNAS